MPTDPKALRYADLLRDVAGLFEMSASGPEDDRIAAALRALADLCERTEANEASYLPVVNAGESVAIQRHVRERANIIEAIAAGYQEARDA